MAQAKPVYSIAPPPNSPADVRAKLLADIERIAEVISRTGACDATTLPATLPATLRHLPRTLVARVKLKRTLRSQFDSQGIRPFLEKRTEIAPGDEATAGYARVSLGFR